MGKKQNSQTDKWSRRDEIYRWKQSRSTETREEKVPRRLHKDTHWKSITGARTKNKIKASEKPYYSSSWNIQWPVQAKKKTQNWARNNKKQARISEWINQTNGYTWHRAKAWRKPSTGLTMQQRSEAKQSPACQKNVRDYQKTQCKSKPFSKLQRSEEQQINN